MDSFLARAWYFFYQDVETLVANGTITKEQQDCIVNIASASDEDIEDTDYKCDHDPLEVESADVVTASNIQYDMEILRENGAMSQKKVNRITEILYNK